jgi:N-acetylmuramoyl-L-alanine amidase
MQDEVFGDGELTSDERDGDEQLLQPDPPRSPCLFDPPKSLDSEELLSASSFAQGGTHIVIVNQALPNEAVANCRVSVSTINGKTGKAGDIILNLSSLGDGRFNLTVMASDIYAGEVGPGFPNDASKDRVWRPLEGEIRIQGGKVTEVLPSELVEIVGSSIRVNLRPVWLRAPLSLNRTGTPDMIVIHHTAGSLQGDLNTFLYGGKVSIHYLIGPDGYIYKLVDDAKKAAHAGTSYWAGEENLNSRSIGIEMSHRTGEYPMAQVDAVVSLVRRIHAAYPNIPSGRVVAHSDIGLCDPASSNPCRPAAPKRLGRKSTDPGSAFPWERIEALGLGIQFTQGSMRPESYSGFFKALPAGILQYGDNDRTHCYGGQIHLTMSGVIAEIQEDMSKLGYYCITNGSYDQVTQIAVRMFQQRAFSGSRRTGKPDHYNSGNGNYDFETAHLVKRALGSVGQSSENGLTELRRQELRDNDSEI